MIEAVVRGNLGRNQVWAHERSEDLLTSTVFGLLRYLPPGQGIIEFLEGFGSESIGQLFR